MSEVFPFIEIHQAYHDSALPSHSDTIASRNLRSECSTMNSCVSRQ
ncbi:hypothetical protein H6F76_07140 [Leptolyngbya sp. FACHB-321]|nr:hypothetical protein [Leptolyngbya sp. FACHB-321]